MIPRRALLVTIAVLLLAPSASAAPVSRKQQRCIAAAESGQQLRSSGKLLEARKAFGACTASICPSVIRRDCGKWIDEIDAATPSITVTLEDENGVESSEGRVLLDGEPLLRADGRATPIDPGPHRFVWSRDSGTVDQELVIREGEHNRVVILRAPRAERPPPPASTAAPSEGGEKSPLPWIVGGSGLAVAAVGGIFWGIGLHDRSTLESTCAAAHTCAQSDVDSSHTKLVVGDVLLGIGVVAMAGALYLFLRQSGPPSTTASR